jgi:hypothetical protein
MKQRARFEITAAQTVIAFLASAPAMASSWKLRPVFEKVMRRVFFWREAVRCAGVAAACALLLAPAGIGRAQEVFSSSYSSVTTNDAFSASCISGQKPNIWKQLGVNPLTCYTQTMGQDADGQCSLKGATVVAHQGGVCYYCEALNPPGQLYVPYDLVEAVSSQGYLCGASPVDPGCMAVCTQQFKTTTTDGPKKTDGGEVPSKQKVPVPTETYYIPIDTSTTSWDQPCQPAPPDQPPAAPYVRYGAGMQAGFNDCKVIPSVVENVAAAAFGSVYGVIPSTLEISTSAKTMQSVIHPAGASANANPYLEGEADGGRLCAWLLKNDADHVKECPGKVPPPQKQPPPVTQQPLEAGTTECAPLTDDGYIFCSGGTGGGQADCSCNDQLKISTCDDFLKLAQKLPKWSLTQSRILQQDLANAKTMLTKAKQHLARENDVATAYGMKALFNDTSANVKTQLSNTVDSELDLLSQIGIAEQHIYPDLYAGQKNSPVPDWAAAYTEPSRTKDLYPLIFVRDKYWTADSDGRAELIVHELSHLKYAGGRIDLTYGAEDCVVLAHYSGPLQSIPGASEALKSTNLGTGAGKTPSVYLKAYMNAVHTKTPEQWQYRKITTPTGAALLNADSFAQFVAVVSNYP